MSKTTQKKPQCKECIGTGFQLRPSRRYRLFAWLFGICWETGKPHRYDIGNYQGWIIRTCQDCHKQA